ncbi:MAG: LytTR family DNA-binding domain-containing protein [Candidatus Sulfotelmatobacter sp.]
MNSLRVLIVDDEPLIRQGIRNGLSGCEGIEIAGECDSGLQAIDTILSARPDLVLLDVQMPDCTGLDVVRDVGPQRMPAVIFVTAYDQYAVSAFELNAVDYLLKPFDDDRLRAAIGRARERISSQREASLAQQLQALLEMKERKWPERLAFRDGEAFCLVPVDTVDWIESANNYVVLHCGLKHHIMGETLTNLENSLSPDSFLRIHRCRIVNVSRVSSVRPFLSGTYQLELHNGTRLSSGKQYGEAVRKLIRK